jgi:glycosyltransferase involved in cell wall biosynthesis
MPIQVLYFDHTAELGGAEIALADLVRRLDFARIKPVVLLGSDGPLRQRLTGSVPVHVLPIDEDILRARRDSLGPRSFGDFTSPLRLAKYVLRLRSCIAAFRPDILHTNSLKAAILGGLAGRTLPVKVIWHIRDRISGDYLPPKTAALVRFLARTIPHFIVANSRATLSTLHLRRKPSAVVASGVDLSRFSVQAGAENAPTNQARRAKIVGIIGRICPWKGQHIFVEAADRVLALYPTTRFQIIGAAMFNDQPYEEQLRASIQRRGLSEQIELTGFQEDVGRAIRSLDIVVHASTLGEPFGQTIVQGMACGKPVIATDGGGVPELVVHGQTGLLVPMGDAKAMGAAICLLLGDEATARQMGESGYQRVLDHFTIDATTDKLMRIYESLVPGRSQPDAKAGNLIIQGCEEIRDPGKLTPR